MTTQPVPVSTVPAVMTYLLNAIQAQVANDPLNTGIDVKLGQPGANLPNDVIFIGQVRRRLAPATFIGGGGEDWENEVYDIDLTVVSWLPTGDPDDSSTYAIALNNRMWQLVGYIETAVRLDPSLGELVTIAYPSSTDSEGPEWPEDGSGFRCLAEVTIHVECLN